MKTMSPQEKELLNIIKSNIILMDILETLPQLWLKEYFVWAWAISQTVRNYKFWNEITYAIKDVDIAFFDDSDLSYEYEDIFVKKAKELMPNIPFELDVKNQARVHLWYKEHYWNDVPPYTSIYSAIDTRPTTSNCVGIRKQWDDFKVYAPYGLDDLLNGIVRANKKQITEDVYDKKVARRTKHRPQLKVIPR